MFVRWKARVLTGDPTGRRGPRGGIKPQQPSGTIPRRAYHAQLVENRWVEGRHRQHVVAYLGSYKDGDPERVEARVAFWQRVDERLASLPVLVSDEERAQIAAALARRMPRPGKGKGQGTPLARDRAG